MFCHLWCQGISSYNIDQQVRTSTSTQTSNLLGITKILLKLTHLGLSDTTWHHTTRSTLVQVIAHCLMALSQYLRLSQCWLIINKVLWHSSEGNFTGNAQDMYPSNESENDYIKFTATSWKGQWVNSSPFCRQYFQMHFHEWKISYFD